MLVPVFDPSSDRPSKNHQSDLNKHCYNRGTMTTNVFDSIAGVVSTDSRWSVRWGNQRLIYVDDTDFHKIEIVKNAVFMFAGHGMRIQEWKNWLRSSPDSGANRPMLEGIVLTMVSMDTRKILMQHGVDIERAGAYFAGTGARFAVPCWQTNRDAVKSVATAIQSDPWSGGKVKFVDLVSKSNNLVTNGVTACTDINAVGAAILTRGTVMQLSQNSSIQHAPFQLSQLAANDSDLSGLVADLVAQRVVPEAPCDGMFNEWTQEEVRALDCELAKLFEWK